MDAAVDVNRPPEEVFDYCSDHRHEPEWNQMMRRSEKMTKGPIGVGTRYAAEFVKAPPMVMECIRFERPSTWEVDGTSAWMTARGSFQIESAPGGAYLTMHMELELRGPLKLAGPLLRHRMQPMLEQDLRNVKARLEASVSS